MREINYNQMTKREEYENLFQSFGSSGCSLTSGINCEHFHKYSKWKEFEPIIEKAENLITQSKNVSLEDLQIEKAFDLYGKTYGKKIIPPIFYKFGLILNYFIDLYSSEKNSPKSILEVGAGYGGLAYLMMNKFKGVKYIIIDVQPILSVSAIFLHKMGKKVAFINEIDSVDDFLLSDKDCLFLHPQEIIKISDKSIDLSINVDSLFEMPYDVAQNYLEHFDRVTKDKIYSNNRKLLHGSEFTNTLQYQSILNNFSYNMKESDHIKHSGVERNREWEIIFQLTLFNGYNHELYEKKLKANTMMNDEEFMLVKKTFKENKPFPHVILDYGFPNEILDGTLKNVLKLKDTYDWLKLCTNTSDFSEFGEDAVQLTNYLISDEWVNFLRELTDIKDLRSDKKWIGAGINYEPRGAHLEPHTDFHLSEENGWRRINCLLFLSKEWKKEWGGYGELGHVENGNFVKDISYSPDFNRVVLFETSDISYHGFDLVKCPNNKSRILISCYYYSDNPGPHTKTLKKLESLQQDYSEKQLELGKVHVQRLALNQQLNELQSIESKLEQEYISIHGREMELIKTLHNTTYIGWDKKRQQNDEYVNRKGTGWREIK